MNEKDRTAENERGCCTVTCDCGDTECSCTCKDGKCECTCNSEESCCTSSGTEIKVSCC